MARRLTGRRCLQAAIAIAAAIALAAGAFFARAPVSRALARRHLARADAMLASGNEAGAGSELSAALERDPLLGRALRALAELHSRRGEVERAFLEFQAYTEAFPSDPEGWSGLAHVREAASQPREAEVALGSAIDLVPGRADLRLRRATLRLRTGHSSGARLDAEAALRADGHSEAAAAIVRDASARLGKGECAPASAEPAVAEARRWPGRLGSLIGDFLAAVHARNWTAADSIAKRARSEYPRTMLGPWLDGLASLNFGDLDRAEQQFREALAVSPRSHRPISNLIALWSRQRGPAHTAEELMRLYDRDPGLTYVLPIAAAAYLEDSRPALGEATIRTLVRVLPTSPVSSREAARFFLQLDRPSDAIATAAQGLVRFPADGDLLRAQALGYLKLGDREGALRSWEAAVSARPDDHVAAAQLARLTIALRKDSASRDRALELVRALECDAPSDPDVLGAIGAVLLDASGDATGARPWLEAARDRAPDSPHLRYELAVAYARAQNASGARRELQQALQGGQAFDDEPDARRLLRQLEGQ